MFSRPEQKAVQCALCFPALSTYLPLMPLPPVLVLWLEYKCSERRRGGITHLVFSPASTWRVDGGWSWVACGLGDRKGWLVTGRLLV